MLEEFYKNLEIESSLSEEKAKFINRVNDKFIEPLTKQHDYSEIFKFVAYQKGLNSRDLLIHVPYRESYYPSFRTITNDDFTKTLEVIVILHLYYAVSDKEDNIHKLDTIVDVAIKMARVDLGVRWNNGMFSRSGAESLDNDLVKDPFAWLSKYPHVQQDYRNALKSYYEGELQQAISSCFLTIEGLAKQELGNKRGLIANSEAFLKHLHLNGPWSVILAKFMEYANDFSRHASEKKTQLDEREVEGFIYLTGLLLRLASRSQEN